MRLTHLSITNLRKFSTLELDLPAIALIQAKNGEGKSSLLEIVSYAFGRGHDPDIVRIGSESGEVIISLDSGAQVKCRASNKTNTTTRGYKAPGATKFTIGRSQIDAMASAISYDPLSLMDLGPKELMEKLLTVMPVNVTPDEIIAAVGDAEPEADGAIVTGMNAIEAIAASAKAIYAARTTLNTEAGAQDKYAAGLEAALPGAEDKDWVAEEGRLRGEKESILTAERAEVKEIGKRLERDKKIAEDDTASGINIVNADINARIAELEKERSKRSDELRSVRDSALDKFRAAANDQATALSESNKPKLEQITKDLAVAEERARSMHQATGTKKAIETARGESAAKKARSELLTAALSRLADLKAALAKRLPISGISFGDDGRLVNTEGVPFQSWNTAAQMTFCLRVAVIAHKGAGFVCIDGAERFDKERRAGLMAAAAKYAESEGMQFLIAGIGDGPLKVEDGGKK